jgi:tRNA (guanine37-N1)-methyltransferase
VKLFVVLTLFPEAMEAYAATSILGVARQKGLVRTEFIDFRDFARDRHRTVDDRPFGGGPGMVLKPEPIAEAVEWAEARHGACRKIALCPSGRRFHQAVADEYLAEERILFLCGRYEGFDERIVTVLGFEKLSLGEFVLAGGELPALCAIEAVARLVPGVLGDERSALEDSYARHGTHKASTHKSGTNRSGPDGAGATSDVPTRSADLLPQADLDHPHWTRPRVWRGQAVPEVLMSGDHAAIARFRAGEALRRQDQQGALHPHSPPPPGPIPPPARRRNSR